MSTYQVKHLDDGAEFERPRILVNDGNMTRDWKLEIDPAVELFHKQLPDYGETALHSLPSVASELGFSHVFVKDESTRFGLPSFKILGASWAIYQTLCKHLGLASHTTIADLTQDLKKVRM
jgi:diaminopropionate ammonia-lyase